MASRNEEKNKLTEQEKEEISPNSSGLIDDLKTVGENSEAREKVYLAKAIQDGIDVDIVSVRVLKQFASFGVISTYRSSRLHKNDPSDEISGMIETLQDKEFVYGAIACLPKVEIFYEILSEDLFKTSITQPIPPTSTNRYTYQPFIEELSLEINSSKRYSDISDVDYHTPLKATLFSETDFTDGELKLNTAKIPVDSEPVNKLPSDSGNKKMFEFITREKDCAFSSGYDVSECYQVEQDTGSILFDWIWGYVEDIRESEDGKKVFVIVSTPLGNAVFPFNVSHDMSDPLWDLIEYAGGGLQNLRGEDVCIRQRFMHSYIYRNRDIGLYSRSNNGFNATRQPQPITKARDTEYEEKAEPVLIDHKDSEVTPIAVDADYIWTLGIPPHDRYTEQLKREENRDEKTGTTISNKASELIDSILFSKPQ